MTLTEYVPRERVLRRADNKVWCSCSSCTRGPKSTGSWVCTRTRQRHLRDERGKSSVGISVRVRPAELRNNKENSAPVTSPAKHIPAETSFPKLVSTFSDSESAVDASNVEEFPSLPQTFDAEQCVPDIGNAIRLALDETELMALGEIFDTAADVWSDEDEDTDPENDDGDASVFTDPSADTTATDANGDESRPASPEADTLPDAQVNVYQSLLLFLANLQHAHNLPASVILNLLTFLSTFLLVFADFVGGPGTRERIPSPPQTIYRYQQALNQNTSMAARTDEDITMYVVCPTCSAMYTLEETRRNSKATPMTCVRNLTPQTSLRKSKKNKRYSRQLPARSRDGRPCNTPLARFKRSNQGVQKLVPFFQYPYFGLKRGLRKLLGRSEIRDALSKWKGRLSVDGYWSDLYDGKVWKTFAGPDGRMFFDDLRNLGFILNVDWFQPFKHTQVSVGGIYLALANLPREERYLPKNIIVLGIMPGPKEASLSQMNDFLAPTTDELLELWQTGWVIEGERFFGALIMVACDLPAARKVSGFTSHASNKMCSMCHATLREPPDIEETESTFSMMSSASNRAQQAADRALWQPRTSEEHRRLAESWRQARTCSEREAIEQEHGVRWTDLLRLPYFDPITMTVIDPMHNLFLGSAKRFFSLMMKNGYVNDTDLDTVQEVLDGFTVRKDIGRIPHKFAASVSGITANQWKNWTAIYSIPALNLIIDAPRIRQLWKHFVEACLNLVQPSISESQLEKGDAALLKFIEGMVETYGDSYPNLHLHGHLRECIENYGPVFSFWLFSFERYNGICSAVPASGRVASLPKEFLQWWLRNADAKAALGECDSPDMDYLKQMFKLERNEQGEGTCGPNAFFNWPKALTNTIGSEAFPGHPISPGRPRKANADERAMLLRHYRTKYDQTQFSEARMNSQVIPFTRLRFRNVTYGLTGTRFFKYKINENQHGLASIIGFITHDCMVQGASQTHTFAKVRVYKKHTEEFSALDCPSISGSRIAEVWHTEPKGIAIIPVACIGEVCAYWYSTNLITVRLPHQLHV